MALLDPAYTTLQWAESILTLNWESQELPLSYLSGPQLNYTRMSLVSKQLGRSLSF